MDGPVIEFDLPRGNRVEIRLRAKLSPEEFRSLQRIFELSEVAFVEQVSKPEEPSDG